MIQIQIDNIIKDLFNKLDFSLIHFWLLFTESFTFQTISSSTLFFDSFLFQYFLVSQYKSIHNFKFLGRITAILKAIDKVKNIELII